MSTIVSLYRKISSLNTNDVCQEAMESSAPEIAKLNAEQLTEGKDATGQPVGQYRNELYATMKNQMNPKPGFGVVDLRLTGAFQRSLVTSVIGESVITEGLDGKSADLAKKYGDEIYGLNSTFKARFISQTLGPAFRKRITDLTGLKFT